MRDPYPGPFERSHKWVPTQPDYTCEHCGKTLPMNVRPWRLDPYDGDGPCDLPNGNHHRCLDGREWFNETRELPPANEIYIHVLVWLMHWMQAPVQG